MHIFSLSRKVFIVLLSVVHMRSDRTGFVKKKTTEKFKLSQLHTAPQSQRDFGVNVLESFSTFSDTSSGYC